MSFLPSLAQCLRHTFLMDLQKVYVFFGEVVLVLVVDMREDQRDE
jgi:hypothetical protein